MYLLVIFPTFVILSCILYLSGQSNILMNGIQRNILVLFRSEKKAERGFTQLNGKYQLWMKLSACSRASCLVRTAKGKWTIWMSASFVIYTATPLFPFRVKCRRLPRLLGRLVFASRPPPRPPPPRPLGGPTNCRTEVCGAAPRLLFGQPEKTFLINIPNALFAGVLGGFHCSLERNEMIDIWDNTVRITYP